MAKPTLADYCERIKQAVEDGNGSACMDISEEIEANKHNIKIGENMPCQLQDLASSISANL